MNASKKIIFDNGRLEKSKWAISASREAITTKVGLKEMEESKACTRLIHKKSYELFRFLRSYDVHTSEFAIYLGGCKVRVDNKPIHIHAFRTNLLIDISKLLLYALAQLIWCS